MTRHVAMPPGPAIVLPPAFTWMAPPFDADLHVFACDLAPTAGAGALASRNTGCLLELAVVLEPDEPLHLARRVFLVCMSALAEAVGRCAPPEKPVTIAYPDTVRFDGARLGGGRLAWPETCREEDIPDWLVFSAMLTVCRPNFIDPGLTPDSTTLEEEGFEPDAPDAVVEGFARHLLLGVDTWRDRGFAVAGAAYLHRVIRGGANGRPRIAEPGDLVTGDGVVHPLAPALQSPSWLDPATGAPRA